MAFLGIPFDMGTTYRAGTRFGPQGTRRISALYTPYFYEFGVDLVEQVKMCDLGDVLTIGNIEKSFDQVSRAVSHVFASGCFPFLMGRSSGLLHRRRIYDLLSCSMNDFYAANRRCAARSGNHPMVSQRADEHDHC